MGPFLIAGSAHLIALLLLLDVCFSASFNARKFDPLRRHLLLYDRATRAKRQAVARSPWDLSAGAAPALPQQGDLSGWGNAQGPNYYILNPVLGQNEATVLNPLTGGPQQVNVQEQSSFALDLGGGYHVIPDDPFKLPTSWGGNFPFNIGFGVGFGLGLPPHQEKILQEYYNNLNRYKTLDRNLTGWLVGPEWTAQNPNTPKHILVPENLIPPDSIGNTPQRFAN